jgi:cytochrome P450
MLSGLSRVVRRAASASVTRTIGEDMDLSRVKVVPRSLRPPLKRIGVDPHPRLTRMREDEPFTELARFFGRTIWLASGHAEVRAVLADSKSFSNDIRPFVGRGQAKEEHAIGGLGFTDPPEHTRLRQILTPEFTMARLERLRPRITQIVHQQLDLVEAAGPTVDLVQDFALPIPFAVISELLGLDQEEREEFWRIGTARFDVSAGGVGAFDAASESRDFLLAATRKQRQSPGEGLIGSIIKQLGDEIDDITLSGLADGVLLGGYETTASTLALGIHVLLQSPEGMALLRADDESVSGIVEELLRYLSVVQVAFPRFAKRDMVVLGRKISAGDVLIASLSGANRDAGLGDQMERFDPTRGPVSHVAFGYGFHRCVGAELARMELRTAYPALLRRFPDLRLAVRPDQLKFRKLSLVYGLESLPVQLGDPS